MGLIKAIFVEFPERILGAILVIVGIAAALIFIGPITTLVTAFATQWIPALLNAFVGLVGSLDDAFRAAGS